MNFAIALEPQESEQQRVINKPSLNGVAHCGHYCAHNFVVVVVIAAYWSRKTKNI